MIRRVSGNHNRETNLLVMQIFLLLIAILLSSTSYAADSKDTMEKEIQHLFDYLKNSDCEFNRNGKWYNTEEAVKHINKKYQYLYKNLEIQMTSKSNNINKQSTHNPLKIQQDIS